jgi:hypothetical protein
MVPWCSPREANSRYSGHPSRPLVLRFMEHEGSLQCSQKPATGPYVEPDESNPHPQTLFP